MKMGVGYIDVDCRSDMKINWGDSFLVFFHQWYILWKGISWLNIFSQSNELIVLNAKQQNDCQKNFKNPLKTLYQKEYLIGEISFMEFY